MRARNGFTMIEVIIVLAVSAILMSIAVPQIGRVQAQRAARNARDAFVWLANRARMASVERGETVQLSVDPTAKVAAMVTATGDTIDKISFTGDYAADVSTSGGGTVTVCYTPRGYALSTCPSSQQQVNFYGGADTASAVIRVLGQVVSE